MQWVLTVKELSLSAPIKIIADTRDSLYFDKWEYSISFRQTRISDARGLNLDHTKANISWRRQSKFWTNDYSDINVSNIFTTLNFLKAETVPFKITFSGSYCSVYTDDPDFVNRLVASCPYVNLRYVKQAVVELPRDVVLLEQSDFAFRSYFKSQWVSDTNLESLESFFQAQQEHIRPSKAFADFMKSRRGWNRHWIPTHYYIEYNDPGYPVMMSLILPRSTRKTLPIACRINN